MGQARRRKEAGVDGPRDVEVEPGQAAGSGLELLAIAPPIDEKRPYQRRHQRQDERNRDTEQRRLHAVSTPGPAEILRTGRCAQASEKSLVTNDLSTICVAGS